MRKVRITGRDLELFRYLFAAKVATRLQIVRDVFGGTHPANVSRRLKKLSERSFLTTQGHENSSGRIIKIYHVGALGRSTIGEKEIDKLSFRNQLISDSIGHDLALVDLRNGLLSRQMVLDFWTENTYRSTSADIGPDLQKAFEQLRPDAAVLVKFKKGDVILPVEYEASLKGKSRCVEKLVRYHLQQRISVVFFVCETAKVYKRFFKIEESLRQKYGAKVYFCMASDIKTASQPVAFINPNMEKIVLS